MRRSGCRAGRSRGTSRCVLTSTRGEYRSGWSSLSAPSQCCRPSVRRRGCAVEGWLGRDAVGHLGMQGIRPPAQANQDGARAGGVPEGLGEGARLGAGCPLRGGGGTCLAGTPWRTRIPTPPASASQMPPPPGTPRATPKKLASPRPRPVRASPAAPQLLGGSPRSAPRPLASQRPCANAGARM